MAVSPSFDSFEFLPQKGEMMTFENWLSGKATKKTTTILGKPKSKTIKQGNRMSVNRPLEARKLPSQKRSEMMLEKIHHFQ